MIIILVILALLVLLWLYLIAPQLSHRPDFTEFRKVDYAHRGLHNIQQGVPENSLRAFSLAALCGFGMELDVQLTKDGQVVVHHDADIRRSCGANVVIADVTYEELKQYRLFGTGEHIPLFSEVLAAVDGKTPLIVELKSYNEIQTLCALTMDLLKGYKGLYCVESFDPDIVALFREYYPEVVRGQLMEHLRAGKNGLSGFAAFWGRNLLTNIKTRPHFEAYDFTARNNLSLKAARAVFDMQEVSWTLRTEQDYRIAKAAGNLCIFEHILPTVAAMDWREKNFADILEQYRAQGVPVGVELTAEKE